MSAKQLRGDFALGPAVATAEEAEPEVAPPSEGAPGTAIGTLIICGFAALGDDTVLSILLHLAVNGHAQAVANVSLCSRRLWRLCGTESLWVDMCRSVYAFSSLPRGTPALRHCYAARRALPLRLAHELDLAIGGLKLLLERQAAEEALPEADEALMEPPIYSSTGLERELVRLPSAEAPPPAQPPRAASPSKSTDATVRRLPTSHPSLESLVMYRIFRAGLGLTTYQAGRPSARPVDDHDVGAAQTELIAENKELASMLEVRSAAFRAKASCR